MTSHSTVVNVTEAGSQNFAIEEDARGIIYIGNLSGVVEYDGEWWRLIKLPEDNSAYVLEALPDGKVATGGWNEIGYLEPDERGTMRYHTLMPLVPEGHKETGEVGEIISTKDGVMFLTTSLVALWTGSEVRILREIDYENDYWRAFKVRDEVWFATASGLKRLSGGKIEDLPGGELYKDRKVRMITEWDETHTLIFVREDAFYLFDGEKDEPFARELWPRAREAFPFAGKRLRDGRLAIVTVSGGVIILSPSGEVDELIDTSTGLPDSDIVGALVASDGALWLVMDNNVTRVEAASPVTIIDTRGGLRGTPVAIVRHEGMLYVGTTSGLFRIDPEGVSWQASDRRVARPVDEEIYSAWSLLVVGDELFAGTGTGIRIIRNGKPELIDGTKDETAYALLQSRVDPDMIWVGTTAGFGSLKREGGKWAWQGRIEGIPNAVRSMVEISENQLWLGTSFDGLLRVTLNDGAPPTIEKFGENEVSVYDIGGRTVLTSDEDHVQMVGKDGKLVPDSLLGKMGNGTLTFVVAEDAAGNVWLNSQPPGVALKQPDGSFVFDDRMLLGMPGKDIQAIYPDEEGVIWFGSDQGLVRFDQHALWTPSTPRIPSIHRITVGGDTIDSEGPVELRHAAGRLRFEVTAVSFDPGVQYHYRLDPAEADWSEWSPEPVTEYTNLWEGRYTFRVQSRNPRGEVSPDLTWTFEVLPPWYRTRTAYAIWALLGISTLVVAPIARIQWLRSRARHLKRLVDERTSELTDAQHALEAKNQSLEEAQERIAALMESSSSALEDLNGWANAMARDLAKSMGIDELSAWLLDAGEFRAVEDTKTPAPTIGSLLSASAPGSMVYETDRIIVPATGLTGTIYGALVIGKVDLTLPERRIVTSFARQLGEAIELQKMRHELSKAESIAERRRQDLIDSGVELLHVCRRCGSCYNHMESRCQTDGEVLRAFRLLPFRVNNRYRLVQILGRGGMGTVFKAHDEKLDRDVAVKIINSEHFQNTEIRQRFEREARALASITHPGVVSIYDFGDLEDRSGFLVTELLQGSDLARLIRQFGRGTPHQVARFLLQGSSALAAAHQAGFIHRDVKPANFFLTLMENGAFEVKVLDFGIAKPVELDTNLTKTGAFVGTPAYMSPEQLSGGNLDRRSDIYSFAAAAFEALTGRRVTTHTDYASILREVVLGEPPLVSELLPSAPGVIDDAFRTALAKRPEERPDSIEAWVDSFIAPLERMRSDSRGWLLGSVDQIPTRTMADAWARDLVDTNLIPHDAETRPTPSSLADGEVELDPMDTPTFVPKDGDDAGSGSTSSLRNVTDGEDQDT